SRRPPLSPYTTLFRSHPHERRPLQAFALHLHAPQRVRLSAPQRGLTEPQPAAGRLSGDLSPEVGSSVFALLPRASVLVTPAWGRSEEHTSELQSRENL